MNISHEFSSHQMDVEPKITVAPKRKRKVFENKIVYNFTETLINSVPIEVTYIIFEFLGESKKNFIETCKSYQFIADTYYASLNIHKNYLIWDEQNIKCTISKRMIYFTNELFFTLLATHRILKSKREPFDHQRHNDMSERFDKICELFEGGKNYFFKDRHVFKLAASFLKSNLSYRKIQVSKNKLLESTKPYLEKNNYDHHRILHIYIEMVASGNNNLDSIDFSEFPKSKFTDFLKNFNTLKNLRSLQKASVNDWKQILELEPFLHANDYIKAAHAHQEAQEYLEATNLWKLYLKNTHLYIKDDFAKAFPCFLKSKQCPEFSKLCLNYLCSQRFIFEKNELFETISLLFQRVKEYEVAANFQLAFFTYENLLNFYTFRRISDLFTKAEQHEKAAEMNLKALECITCPSEKTEKLVRLVGFYEKLKDYEKAASFLIKALNSGCYSIDSKNLLWISKIFEKAELFEKASTFLIKSIDKRKGQPNIEELFKICELFEKAKMFDKALVPARHILRLKENNLTTPELKRFINILSENGKFEDAAYYIQINMECFIKDASADDLRWAIKICKEASLFEEVASLYLQIENNPEEDLTTAELLDVCHIFCKLGKFEAIAEICILLIDDMGNNATCEDLEMAIKVCERTGNVKKSAEYQVRLNLKNKHISQVQLLSMAKICQKLAMNEEASKVFLNLNANQDRQLNSEILRIAIDICIKAQSYEKAANYGSLLMSHIPDLFQADPDDILLAYKANAKAGRYESAEIFCQYEKLIQGKDSQATYKKLFEALEFVNS